MKKIFVLLMILLVITSCGSKKKTLHIYNWGDYIDPAVVSQFEKDFNCVVKMDFYDSNEALYTKLKAGASGYDIAVPSSFMAAILEKQGLLLKLDHSKLPNLANLDKKFMAKHPDPDNSYSVPYMMSFIGIGYNSKKVKNFQPSWSQFDRVDLKGKITMLDEMRPCLGAALKFLGYSLNSTNSNELSSAAEVVIRWKKNIAKFDVDGAKRGLAAGEFDLIHNYSGDVLQIQKENPDLLFGIPKEGTSINDDDLVIPSAAKEIELAYKFINYLQRPDICAQNMNYICYLAPNIPAQKLMPESFRKNPSIFPDAGVMAKCEVMRDLGADNEKYSKLWDKIKAAQ